MAVKLLTEHHLAFLRLKGGCTCSFESTLFNMQHFWKSVVAAQMLNVLVSGIRLRLACAYNKDSNKSAYPHSLMIVYIFYLHKCWTLGYRKDAH